MCREQAVLFPKAHDQSASSKAPYVSLQPEHLCAQMAPGFRCPSAGGSGFLDCQCPALRVPVRALHLPVHTSTAQEHLCLPVTATYWDLGSHAPAPPSTHSTTAPSCCHNTWACPSLHPLFSPLVQAQARKQPTVGLSNLE